MFVQVSVVFSAGASSLGCHLRSFHYFCDSFDVMVELGMRGHYPSQLFPLPAVSSNQLLALTYNFLLLLWETSLAFHENTTRRTDTETPQTCFRRMTLISSVDHGPVGTKPKEDLNISKWSSDIRVSVLQSKNQASLERRSAHGHRNWGQELKSPATVFSHIVLRFLHHCLQFLYI